MVGWTLVGLYVAIEMSRAYKEVVKTGSIVMVWYLVLMLLAAIFAGFNVWKSFVQLFL